MFLSFSSERHNENMTVVLVLSFLVMFRGSCVLFAVCISATESRGAHVLPSESLLLVLLAALSVCLVFNL